MTKYTYSLLFKIYFKYETVKVDWETNAVLRYMLRGSEWKPVGKYSEVQADVSKIKNQEVPITKEEFERLRFLDKI